MPHHYFGPEGEGQIILAAGAVILDSRQRVLLVRHRPEREGFWKGKWICPGGRVELGESLEEAVRREVAEETGLQIEIRGWLTPFDRIVKKEGRVRLHVVYLDCIAAAEGTPVAGDDVGEAFWFSVDQIRDMLSDLHEDTRKLLTYAEII